MLKISLAKDSSISKHQVLLISNSVKPSSLFLPKSDEQKVIAAQKSKLPQYQRFDTDSSLTVIFIDESKEVNLVNETIRKTAYSIVKFFNSQNIKEVVFSSVLNNKLTPLFFAEGAILSSYQFLKYKTKEKKTNSFLSLHLVSKDITQADIKQLQSISEANFLARDLVNEYPAQLTAVQLSKEIQKAGKDAGFKVTVFDKKKIEALKMGGLLAVNKGSKTPPTFSILEYKPAKAKNKQPLVLVGKGVVYDTGGLSLKPTPNSMDMMKCDMAGAATVVGALYAIAKLNLPIHVVGLIPATDNRPGEDAYVPGDIVKMMNGINVEVLNTDAEGRMILADALAYAERYKPSLVLDFATLTGAAKAAIGQYGTIFMGTANEDIKQKLVSAGFKTHERLVEFPFWDDYKNLVKSEVADIKNIGGPEAGMITAGKFLEYFTNYPWLHFDIAGTAYIMGEDSYRGKYGTGVGVRMLVEFIKNYS
jgi:leucyl aminopeptidase